LWYQACEYKGKTEASAAARRGNNANGKCSSTNEVLAYNYEGWLCSESDSGSEENSLYNEGLPEYLWLTERERN
jgi:hypothetical protein